MEPLLPGTGTAVLADLSTEIHRKFGELSTSLPSVEARREVARLVKSMNCYYSNLIEGHKTLPTDIERALVRLFSDDPDSQRNQRLSAAHIHTESAMTRKLREEPGTNVFSQDFVCWLHRELYSHLPPEEWITTSRSGVPHPIEPGFLRSHNVDVGRHTPPDHQSLAVFMNRFEEVYGNAQTLATNRLTAAAAAHHRLVWIHPFGDGNGRVARLHSQAALISAGLNGEGLWTLSRGLARKRQEYFNHLASADEPRRNDFDGRGNLSDLGLVAFCEFFLRQVLDQITFMIGLISPFDLEKRVESYFRFVRIDLPSKNREHLSRLVRELCLRGQMARGEVAALLGVKSTTARAVIGKALAEGLVSSPSEKGPLRIAFPASVTDYYFPDLFRDLPVEG